MELSMTSANAVPSVYPISRILDIRLSGFGGFSIRLTGKSRSLLVDWIYRINVSETLI
jgi:hypothetical protein